MRNTKKKSYKSTLIGALVIGILGSALWERVFSPFTNFVFLKISSFISYFVKNWNDRLYGEISNGFIDKRIHLILVFLVVTILLIATHTLFKDIFNFYDVKDCDKYQKNKNYEKIDSQLTKRFFISDLVQNIVYIFIFSLVFSYFVGESTFIQTVKTRTLSNIEIVSPYIDDSEYKMFKSKFFSMQCEDDYISLSGNLSDIAKKHDLKLK